ncbi:hypothetical protein AB4144_54310 [Rhizobiaceae sp. 2RAB30]
MNALNPIGIARNYFYRIRRMREEIRTEQLISSLPREIRKDIGWPDTYAARRARRA